jgi:putative transposase
VLHDVLSRLDRTFQAFFRRVQAGERPGFPRFKGRNRSHAFTCKEHGNGARLDNGHLVLAKIGHIGVQWSRPVEPSSGAVQWRLVRARPRRSPSPKQPRGGMSPSPSPSPVPRCRRSRLRPLGQETGIDRGLESFATLADGTRILTPGYYRKAERYLAKCQRRVSRRKQGSHRRRRRKAVCWLAKAHQRVRRQRQDFHHKTALALVRHYDTLSHEELQVRNRVKHHHLAKSIADAGWRAFLAILSFTAARAGRSVHAVDPACTSQACSGCGVVVQTGLCVRWHECPECGTSLHRDHNAAKTILWRGQRLRGLAGTRGDSRGSLRE